MKLIALLVILFLDVFIAVVAPIVFIPVLLVSIYVILK